MVRSRMPVAASGEGIEKMEELRRPRVRLERDLLHGGRMGSWIGDTVGSSDSGMRGTESASAVEL